MKPVTFLFLFVLSGPLVVQAQGPPPRVGMVLVEGIWQAPTPELALQQLKLPNRDGDRSAPNAAQAVLRQIFESRPPEELAAFAEELGRIFRDGDEPESQNALMALLGGGSNFVGPYGSQHDGTPYTEGAIEVLIRVMESLDDLKQPGQTVYCHKQAEPNDPSCALVRKADDARRVAASLILRGEDGCALGICQRVTIGRPIN